MIANAIVKRDVSRDMKRDSHASRHAEVTCLSHDHHLTAPHLVVLTVVCGVSGCSQIQTRGSRRARPRIGFGASR